MTIKLAELEAQLEDVELPDGTVHPVERVNGFTMDLWLGWSRLPEEEREVELHFLWDIAARCLPSASKNQIDALSASQVRAVIEVATGNVEKVLASAKNGDGVELLREPISSPTTPLAPSSSASPEPQVEAPAT